jgi:ABC-type transport system involved in cytochrome bd biosynthesis fused ATPase/permease subunit
MAQFGRIINNYQRAKASSERVYGLMNEPGRLDDAGSEGNRDDGAGLDFDGSGGVEFDDVTFGYDEDPVVADVDLRVEAGETIGFVGPTGRANPPSSSYWFGCTTPTTGRSGSAARTSVTSPCGLSGSRSATSARNRSSSAAQ